MAVLDINDTIYEGEVFNRYGLLLNEEGDYSLMYLVNPSDLCPTRLNISLTVLERPKVDVYFPNAFTPQENTNNLFRYYTVEEDIYFISFEIFDRWGTKVFSTKKIGEYWDGKYKGKDCDIGAFAYKFQYSPRYDKHLVKELSGEFLLLR